MQNYSILVSSTSMNSTILQVSFLFIRHVIKVLIGCLWVEGWPEERVEEMHHRGWVGAGGGASAQFHLCFREWLRPQTYVWALKSYFYLKLSFQFQGTKQDTRGRDAVIPPLRELSLFVLRWKYSACSSLTGGLLLIVADSAAMDTAQKERRRKRQPLVVSDYICLKCPGDIPWGFPEKQFEMGIFYRQP